MSRSSQIIEWRDVIILTLWSMGIPGLKQRLSSWVILWRVPDDFPSWESMETPEEVP